MYADLHTWEFILSKLSCSGFNLTFSISIPCSPRELRTRTDCHKSYQTNNADCTSNIELLELLQWRRVGPHDSLLAVGFQVPNAELRSFFITLLTPFILTACLSLPHLQYRTDHLIRSYQFQRFTKMQGRIGDFKNVTY